MDITEIRQKANELEIKIMELVIAFEKETGITPEGFDVYMIDPVPWAIGAKPKIDSVKSRIRI